MGTSLFTRAPARVALMAFFGALAGCSDSDAPDDAVNAARPPEIVRIMPAAEALAGAEIPKLDPATMNGAEIEKALGSGARCEFQYTQAGKPVLAMKAASGADAAVVKLNGSLVVASATTQDRNIVLLADPVRLTLAPDGDAVVTGSEDARQDANLVFEVGDRLKVGYRGYYRCHE